MLKRKCVDISERERKVSKSYLILILTGITVGFASGYFGIGGGFLIVPGLLFGGGLNIIQAVGTSLMAVGTFGVVTAARYAISGDLNIIISVLFILGGWIGARYASRVPKRRLTQIFAIIVIVVAIYIIYQNYGVVLHL
jgi:uncharacterized membrane protein YfcA